MGQVTHDHLGAEQNIDQLPVSRQFKRKRPGFGPRAKGQSRVQMKLQENASNSAMGVRNLYACLYGSSHVSILRQEVDKHIRRTLLDPSHPKCSGLVGPTRLINPRTVGRILRCFSVKLPLPPSLKPFLPIPMDPLTCIGIQTLATLNNSKENRILTYCQRKCPTKQASWLVSFTVRVTAPLNKDNGWLPTRRVTGVSLLGGFVFMASLKGPCPS